MVQRCGRSSRSNAQCWNLNKAGFFNLYYFNVFCCGRWHLNRISIARLEHFRCSTSSSRGHSYAKSVCLGRWCDYCREIIDTEKPVSVRLKHGHDDFLKSASTESCGGEIYAIGDAGLFRWPAIWPAIISTWSIGSSAAHRWPCGCEIIW